MLNNLNQQTKESHSENSEMIVQQYIPIVYGHEPIKFNSEEVDKVLIWASENKVSDVTFKTGEGVWVKHLGNRRKITLRGLSTAEVGEIVNHIYGANGTATLGSGQEIDSSYLIKIDRTNSIRFRVNATSFMFDGHLGISITIRIIQSKPPALSSLDFDMSLLEPFTRKQGMCLITGETGSGKSTLQASIIRHLVEEEHANLSVLTYESPIEYTQDEVDKPTSLVTAHEIPKNIRSFDVAVRNAVRRDPDIILIGESRDMITISAAIEASRSGHLMMTTLHSNGVASTMRRIISMFPEGERNSRAQDVIENVNMILTQRLVPSTDGKRVALREYLVFTEEIRDTLIDSDVEKLPQLVRNFTRSHGQTMEMDARSKKEKGQITDKEYRRIEAMSRRLDDDSTFDMVGMGHSIQSHFEHLSVSIDDLLKDVH